MDQRTLAFINLYAVLGTLPELCRLSPQAQAYIRNQNVRLGIAVKGGPAATLVFENSTCRLEHGADNCTIKLPFSSPEKFNGMIDGTVTPIPTKGFTKLGFLTGNFIKLTDLLTRYLRASEEDLANEQFFETSTRLMFHLIVEAIAQIGNEDPVGQVSASYIVDGKIQLSIKDGPCAHITAEDHKLTAVQADCEDSLSLMEFADMKLARALFDGKVNAVACVGTGQVRLEGMISQLDNVNRILDRVALYLA